MGFDFLLMQRVKNGDGEAGEQFVKKYYPAIYQYCFLHIHDCHCAEDMAQETFTRFFESLHTYRDYGKAKNYLYCIAGNIIKNFYKKKKEVLLDEIPEMVDNGMEGIELRMDVEQALESLPDELREAAILFFFQELKQKEILVEGLLSIQAGENPRVIEEKLKSFLAPNRREELNAGEGGEDIG